MIVLSSLFSESCRAVVEHEVVETPTERVKGYSVSNERKYGTMMGDEWYRGATILNM